MKLTKTDKSLSGTSYHGHVIKTTYNNLVKAFGPSHQDDGGYKTNHEWLFDIQTSHVIKSVRTILDILNIEYKEEMNLEEYNNEILSDFNFDD